MRYLNTGVITLLLLITHSALADMNQYNSTRETTVTGKIVELDKETGVGILKEKQTNKLVHFRFDKKMENRSINSLKVGHVVEFTLGRQADAVAAID